MSHEISNHFYFRVVISDINGRMGSGRGVKFSVVNLVKQRTISSPTTHQHLDCRALTFHRRGR